MLDLRILAHIPITFPLRDAVQSNVHLLLLTVELEPWPQKRAGVSRAVATAVRLQPTRQPPVALATRTEPPYAGRSEGPENGQPAVREGILVSSRDMATRGVDR
ncbi:hypothetical protein TUSST3_08320 [Streptomyces sp. TUS-ST3]|nr:hypothetical protein TUSST3_08320 [Streptomyces sp. TUS-ST3]